MREWVAKRLRRWAAKLDPKNAPRYTGWTFTFEQGMGVVFRTDRKGCPVAYVSDSDYERAHTEAGTPNGSRFYVQMHRRGAE